MLFSSGTVRATVPWIVICRNALVAFVFFPLSWSYDEYRLRRLLRSDFWFFLHCSLCNSNFIYYLVLHIHYCWNFFFLVIGCFTDWGLCKPGCVKLGLSQNSISLTFFIFLIFLWFFFFLYFLYGSCTFNQVFCSEENLSRIMHFDFFFLYTSCNDRFTFNQDCFSVMNWSFIAWAFAKSEIMCIRWDYSH